MANTKDIRRKQGDTYIIEVTIMDGKNVYDLTGTSEVKLGVAKERRLDVGDTPDLLLVGAVDADPTTGKVSFTITQNEADNLLPDTYHAEIQFIQSGSVVTTDTFIYAVEGQIIF